MEGNNYLDDDELFEDNNNDMNPDDENIDVLSVDEEGCPMTDLFISLLMMDKPLGMLWDSDKMEKFLQARGYKIISRYSSVLDKNYKVAVKADQSYIPETEVDNIREVFCSELQDIILELLLKYSKK